MDEGFSPLSMVLFLVFIGLEAAFYGLGSAIQNVSEADLEKDAEEGNKKVKWLLKIVEQPKYFVYSLQAVTNVIGLILGSYVLRSWGSCLGQWIVKTTGWDVKLGGILGLILAAIVILVVLISFGIVIPKRCGAKKPQYWCYRLVPLVSVVMVPVFPFIMVVTGLSRVILWALRVDITNDNDNVTEEEIMSMVNEGHEQGVLEASEAEMITNIFELDDKEAGDIMTHRTNLVAIDGEMTLKEAVDFILKEGKNSRYPVYEEDIDNIIGILHMKDAMIFAENAKRNKLPVGKIPGLLREAHFIPETKNLDSLFREMQSQKIHMEVVVDEYGQTSGIVTMEDILEEIVGNILDEYDAEEEYISALEDGFVLNGMTPLEEVEEALGIAFEEEDMDSYDTLNGFLVSRLGHIPKKDEHSDVMYGGYQFHILSMENKTIRSVKATRVPVEKQTEEKEGSLL